MLAMQATKDTCQKTSQGTRLVAEDLGVISDSVEQITELNTQIATAAEEQNAVSAEITRNISSMSEIVAEISVNGEKTVNETIELTAAQRQLNTLVEQFKLK